MKRQKRVAAIHDISGFGKCSLTVALPIISAAGIETAVMPTAVLSTHTGGFTGYTYRDLTSDLQPFMDHWKSLDLHFDGIYSGFLGSFEQLDLIAEFVDKFKTNNTIFLTDPVMADHGELYTIFTPEFAKGMATLCRKADIIIPNMTEAAFILEESYHPGPYTKSYIIDTMKKLSKLGPKRVVLTGVFFNDNELGAATYDRYTGDIGFPMSKKIPGYYHGTGDIFGSVVVASLMNGFDLNRSVEIAVKFTTESIQRTYEAKTEPRNGVNFEESIPGLLKNLGLI